MSSEVPELGIVFWPVGSGDSSTIVVTDEVLIQVDLNDRAKADSDDTPEAPVVDLLIEALPTVGDRPFLAAFVLTHADQDHCSGFADLLEKATIGELWATPRMWRELDGDPDAALCDDAQAFHDEVVRRVDAVKKADSDGDEIALGDRVLVVGYDVDEEKFDYHDLPSEYLLKPGMSVTKINGDDHAGRFEAFIHAPFKDDAAGARNDTSLSLQVTLTDSDSGQEGKILLFGDLAYDTLTKIFEYSESHDREQYLEWDLLLAPHHCSKKVMYIVEDGSEVLKKDILESFEKHAREGSVIVASSATIPTVDKAGDNPPHRKAADRYKEYADRFICTMEWPSADDPSPVVFGIDADGAKIVEDNVVELASKNLDLAHLGTDGRRRLSEVAAMASTAGRFATGSMTSSETAGMTGAERVQAAIKSDRGADVAPTTAVGFGRG